MIKLKDIINEITSDQKELKKKYLYHQELKNQPRKFPSFEEFYPMYCSLYKNRPVPSKEKVLNQYNSLDNKLKNLNGQKCYRSINIPSEEVFTIKQLGNMWSYSLDSVLEFLYNGNYNDMTWIKKRHTNRFFIFEGIIEEKNINWLYTISTKFDTEIEQEKEVNFIKNSPIFVTRVCKVLDENDKKIGKWIYVNSFKRC